MKNKNKVSFTPGPWSVKGDQSTAVWAGSKFVAKSEWDLYSNCVDIRLEAVANARLIAAAPELLAALEGLLKVYYNPGFAPFDNARAAIAKAKAE